MKQYKIIVNGTAYEVEIEEISASDVTAKTSAPAPVKTSAPAGGETVTAPIPGTVLSLSFAAGASVKEGDTVLILESMKMENEIVAPVSGKITYAVQKGATVAAGDVLCTIA